MYIIERMKKKTHAQNRKIKQINALKGNQGALQCKIKTKTNDR